MSLHHRPDGRGSLRLTLDQTRSLKGFWRLEFPCVKGCHKPHPELFQTPLCERFRLVDEVLEGESSHTARTNN